jgi:hypothetical protein
LPGLCAKKIQIVQQPLNAQAVDVYLLKRIMDDIEKSTEHYSQLGYNTKKKKGFEMKVPRLHGRPFIIRQLLGLIGVISILGGLFTFFHTTLESSYLDLVDSFLPESSGADISSSTNLEAQLSDESSNSASLRFNTACKEGWIEEWISSGVMPKCSLASHNKIDLLYT